MYSCITQKQMADLLNISLTKYQRKENGLTEIERNEVQQISQILKLDEKTLLTYWMADNLFALIKQDKELVMNALEIIETHPDDYEFCVNLPIKSQSFSGHGERMRHRKNK